MQASAARFAPLAFVVAIGLIAACSPTSGSRSEAPATQPRAAAAPARSAAAPAPAQSAAPSGPSGSFAGKTVIVLVPYTAGGSADVIARQIAMAMPKFIPGTPNVVVQNMPGAGGIVGENWVNNVAPKDGTVVGQFVFPSVVAQTLFHPESVQFELGKLRWLAGISESTVVFVSPDLGIKSGEELPRVTRKIFLGDTSPDSTRGMLGRLLLKLLDKDFQFVMGYGSSGDMRAAIRRGELTMTAEGLSAYSASVKPLVEQGLVVPIAQDGLLQDGKIVRDPRNADLPTLTELVVKLKGEGIKERQEYRALELVMTLRSMLQGWIYAPGVPDETFTTMSAAFANLIADPEVLQTYERMFGFKPLFYDRTQAQAIADSLVTLLERDPAAVELLRQMSREVS